MQSKAFHAAVLSSEATSPLKRRGLILGAGVAGAAALAVKVVPVTTVTAPVAAAGAAVAAEKGGYQLTAHVLRYYQTTRI